ncbi:MAG: hypothetical protein M3340_10415, partial [Actinomycetota bacterium]|nr:hypothetical protein [Actinomycetota bacterium]
SDERGRTVVVHTRCRRPDATAPRGCVVRAGDLGGRGLRTLYRPRHEDDVPYADLHRGTLAVVHGRTGDPRAIDVRARGATGFRRVARGSIGAMRLGRGWLGFETGGPDEYVTRALDLASGLEHDLAIDDQFDNDCRCTGSSSRAGSPFVAGHHAYWLETDFGDHATGGHPVVTRIARADLRQGSPRVEFYDTERPAAEFAVRGPRLVYIGLFGTGEVREVAGPTWRKAPFRIPSRT